MGFFWFGCWFVFLLELQGLGLNDLFEKTAVSQSKALDGVTLQPPHGLQSW